jgi:hypothetical protein
VLPVPCGWSLPVHKPPRLKRIVSPAPKMMEFTLVKVVGIRTNVSLLAAAIDCVVNC